MPDDFEFDVFLSHSSKDKAVASDIAQRLKKDGLKVWFDEWELKPGDSIPAKIEEGLESSRVLVLCMSANAFGPDWAQLESGTFRFRDPLNKDRRFLPLLLDDTPINGLLAKFFYIRWLPSEPGQEYTKLVEACRLPTKPRTDEAEMPHNLLAEKVIQLQELADIRPLFESPPEEPIHSYGFPADGKRVVVGCYDNTLRLWDVATGRCSRVIKGHDEAKDGYGGGVWKVALSPSEEQCLSASSDGTIRLWDLETGHCLRVFANSSPVHDIVWGPDGYYALSGGFDKTVRLWSRLNNACLREFKGHKEAVTCLAWSLDGRRALSGSEDNTVRVWNLANEWYSERLLEGHTRGNPSDYQRSGVWSVAWSADGNCALSGSSDTTVRLWDVATGRCLRVFEGHTDRVVIVSSFPQHGLVISASEDTTLRLWDPETGRCLRVLQGHTARITSVAWSANGQRVFSGDAKGIIRVWDLSEFLTKGFALNIAEPVPQFAANQVQYTNAKVLLVGESGAGKTGLSKRLALNDWQPSDSTVGAWATQWKLPVSNAKEAEREIWLWDFGGQADQRLIHQLYMDETALAVLVFDGQKEHLFETLGQWDRDLTRASRKEFAKLLVAGRVDAGGLRASRSDIEKFAAERKFGGFLETSAKTNLGCEELNQAILDAIPWDELPCRTTHVLFKRLKEEIIALKDEGRVLMRFNELRETLQLRLSGESARFADEELHAVLTLLAGPGVVWELAFGSWVLLQPERINAYAQAVIRTLQADEHQRGCLMEERVLMGRLIYESSMERLQGDEERFVLLAMHQTLVERGLCLRQPTTKGNLLVFPSYYRMERPDIMQYPAVQVNYRFTGFLDEIYATLIVRLHYCDAFEKGELWRYAADFKTNQGKQLGIKLTRRGFGMGDLEVYFDSAVSMEEKIIFSKYVHEHLLKHARDVERLRHYVCPECGTVVGNREVAMKRLSEWLHGQPPHDQSAGLSKLSKKNEKTPSIICVECLKQVPLWDEMEQCFASPEIQQRVRDMQEEAKIELDNESKERALVGEVISTVANAGQLSREFNVSDHGIDLEIEFKTDPPAADKPGRATGRKLYLQLKSGDSYIEQRKSGKEVFKIKDQRHVEYWMAQAFPVLLVIRNSEGEVRWMEVRDWLKRASDNGKKPVKQIVFEGKRFDVMSVRRWRDQVLKEDRND